MEYKEYNEYLEKHADKAFICHLPCRVGDIVYMRYDTNAYTSVVTCIVKNFDVAKFMVELALVNGELLSSLLHVSNLSFVQVPTKLSISEFGKTLFLERYEAEKGTKEMVH